MKRFLSMLLVISMLAASLAMTAPASAVTHGYLLGDADDNGSLSMLDVLLIRKYIVGQVGEKDVNTLAADANKDENHSMPDVMLVRKMISGGADEEGNNTDKLYKVDEIKIANKNISRYTIVIPENPDECVEYFAKTLRDEIGEACGIYLNVTTNEAAVSGYKIKYVYDMDEKLGLGTDGYNVTVDENDNMIFTCGYTRGPVYVTYYFLEEFVGYRYLVSDFKRYAEVTGYRREGYLKHLYEAETVSVPAGYSVTETPGFDYRALSQGGSRSDNFAQLRLNAVDGGGSGSSASPRYGWGLGTLFIHAHSYEYQCDISWQEQPCLTSEETYNQIITYNLNLLNERFERGQYLGKHYTQISCSPNDNTNFCQCTNCKEVYEIEGSIAGTIFRLSNRVCERLNEDYPGIEIFTIAYWDARNPPKITRPDERICVCFCISGCNNHSYDKREECEAAGGNPRPNVLYSNHLEMDYFDKWCELTNNIYTWYYSANFTYYMAPSPNVFNVYDDFKYMAEMGIAGVYCEGSGSPYYSFEWLRGYLATKMMWNPMMSEEEFNDHINEFLMIYYGEGWQYIRQYLDLANEAGDQNGCWTNNFDRPLNMYNEEYFAEHFEEMIDLFQMAYETTTDEEQKFRIMMCSLHCYFLGLTSTFEDSYENGDEASRDLYVRRYKWLLETIIKYEVKVTSISGSSFDKYGCSNRPINGEIINPIRWIFDDFTGYWIYDTSKGKWV